MEDNEISHALVRCRVLYAEAELHSAPDTPIQGQFSLELSFEFPETDDPLCSLTRDDAQIAVKCWVRATAYASPNSGHNEDESENEQTPIFEITYSVVGEFALKETTAERLRDLERKAIAEGYEESERPSTYIGMMISPFVSERIRSTIQDLGMKTPPVPLYLGWSTRRLPDY